MSDSTINGLGFEYFVSKTTGRITAVTLRANTFSQELYLAQLIKTLKASSAGDPILLASIRSDVSSGKMIVSTLGDPNLVSFGAEE